MQSGYLNNFSTPSVLFSIQSWFFTFFKVSMIKIEPSTFHNEYFGLEDNITSLLTKTAYMLNAFNKVKIQAQMKFSTNSWKVIRIENRISTLSILSSAKVWKTTSKSQTSLCISFSFWKKEWHWLLPNYVFERTNEIIYVKNL